MRISSILACSLLLVTASSVFADDPYTCPPGYTKDRETLVIGTTVAGDGGRLYVNISGPQTNSKGDGIDPNPQKQYCGSSGQCNTITPLVALPASGGSKYDFCYSNSEWPKLEFHIASAGGSGVSSQGTGTYTITGPGKISIEGDTNPDRTRCPELEGWSGNEYPLYACPG